MGFEPMRLQNARFTFGALFAVFFPYGAFALKSQYNVDKRNDSFFHNFFTMRKFQSGFLFEFINSLYGRNNFSRNETDILMDNIV